MKIKYLIFIIICAVNFSFLAQNEFIPGFYLVNNNAKYAQFQTPEEISYARYQPSSEDELYSYGTNLEYTEEGPFVTRNSSEGGKEYLYYQENFDLGWISKSKLTEGQIVFAFMVANMRVYCFDLIGNQIVFSGINDLTKAPNNGSIGQMEKGVSEELMEGPTLRTGFYWILSQNTTNGTVKIQLPKTTVDIKSEKIIFWKKHIGSYFDNVFQTNGDENEFIDITIVK